METPIRALLASKQIVIVAVSGVLAGLGAVGVATGTAWLAGLALFVFLVVMAAVAADVHRKVGKAIAQIRAIEGQSSALGSSVSDFGRRLDAIERARESAVAELASLRSQLLTRFDLLNKEISVNSKRLAKAAEVAGEATVGLSVAMDSEARNIGRMLSRASNGLESNLLDIQQTVADSIRDSSSREMDQLITETDAILQLHRRLQFEGPVPLMGGWAMSAVGMKTLIDLAIEREVSMIVECGSGTSTVYLAMALQRAEMFDTRIVSLDALEVFAEATRSQLDALGLDVRVDVRVAPLESVVLDGETFRWYSASVTEDLSDIDLLVVDGPPGATGYMARYPAYPLLRDRLSSDAVIVLDDTNRDDERRAANRWLKDDSLRRSSGYPSRLYVLEYHSA